MQTTLKLTRLSLSVILLAFLTLISGCSSQRSAGKKASVVAEVPADVTLQTPQQRFGALCDSYGEWQDVSLPVKVSLRSPKSLSLSARAVMKRGSWISVSVRMLGFEVASVWIDNDSVHAIDRYHKAYLSESIGSLLGNTGVSVADIQDLLLGRGFLLGAQGGTFTAAQQSAVSLQPTAEGLMILPVSQPGRFQYGFILPPAVNCIGAATVAAGDKYEAVIAYADFIKTSHSGEFAGTADIEMVKGKKMAATLVWNFSSAKWNTGVNQSWKRPSGYSRMTPDKILNALTRL